jgi:RND family efflux transporter MFP subunit
MRIQPPLPTLLFCLFVLAPTAGGCKKDAVQETLPAPEVTVATPVSKELIDYERFPGTTEPVEKVDIRARVTGYLTKIEFKPGADVEKDQPLFEIDRRPYQADLDRAEGQVALAKARVDRLNRDYQRNEPLFRNGTIAPAEWDKIVGDRDEAVGALKAATSNVAGYKLNLDFTKIAAPISGQIGDWLVTEGNLVNGGQGNSTQLTTIVSVDPMDVAFNVDENTFQRLRKEVREGRIKVTAGDVIPVEMGLSVDGSAYPYKGTVNFIDNEVNTKTGTTKVKARFANPKPAVGSRPLNAGEFARIRVPIGEPRKVIMVPESALGTDQGQRYLYVVDDNNAAVRLDVNEGSLENRLREIIGVKKPADDKYRALKDNERVIVKGLQRVRPGMTVEPQTAE